MRRFCCTLAALVSFLIPGFSRADTLQLDLKMEHSSVLQYEMVIGFLTIANSMQEPFIISEQGKRTAATLEFVVRKDTGEHLPRMDKGPVARNIYIESDQREELMFDIGAFYDLREPGRYLIGAMVTWNGKTYWSEQRMLDVVTGLEITSVARSMKDYPERVRNYTLKYWSRETQEFLFLVVDENYSKMNYGVFQLGALVRTFKPRIDVDRAGNVHTVHMVGNDCYVHSFFKSLPDGVRFVDRSYRRANGELFLLPPGPAEKPSKR